MPNLAANLSTMFTEVEFMQRFAAAANAGFKAVEYLFPYDYAANDIAKALQDHKLQQVLFNLPAGDWGSGERGNACIPGREDEFRQGVDKAISYAQALQCTRINCLAGRVPADSSDEQIKETYVANVRYAAEQLQAADICLLIEMINTVDVPGYYLTTTAQALDILAEIDHPNVKLQYDIYHMQIMEGDLARTIKNNLQVIQHMQLADNPGRHEPGTGEINYHFLFNWLDEIGYKGWVGCEYIPKTTTEAGLAWLQSHNQI